MNQPDVTSKDRFLASRQRYQRIVNKASCLSLVSNAILYWNTIKIAETVVRLRAQGEDISDEKRYRTSLCCRSGMSYRMARTLSRIAKLVPIWKPSKYLETKRKVRISKPRFCHSCLLF